MHSIFDVAKFFLNKEKMNTRRLQYLCWYAYSWYMYFYKIELFEEKPKITPYGLVYYSLKINLRNNCKEIEEAKNIVMDKEVLFLNCIFEKYGTYSTKELMRTFKNELPFIKAEDGKFPVLSIIEEYDKQKLI